MPKLATRILVAMIVGGLAGALLHGRADAFVHWVADPVGTVFLRLLLMLVLPLATTAVVLGVLELEPVQLARVGGRAAGMTLLLTGIAVAVGVATTELIGPGRGLRVEGLPAAEAVKPASADPVALLVDLVPSNVAKSAANGDLVPVLVFAVVFALALRRVEGPGGQAVRQLLLGIYDVSARAITGVLALAPIGVAALMFELGATGGFSALRPLASFVGVVLLGLGFQLLVVYPLALLAFAGRNPIGFFREVRPALAVAFSTASSAATLPTSLRVAEENLLISPETARFVLTVGATANQNGTALFEGVTVLFLAQLYGVDLTWAQAALVCGVAIVGGIGTAGVPGGALPVIAATLAVVGVPPEAVGVIVGVDRLLDMCRTTLNVAGDLVIADVVAGRRSPGPASLAG
ncbi:MAG: dicarboxylate/amino acid:cation symporter [Deltaproteobacteria bacterium]|nr:dicarboxylate/amino acid:cation symporter [Deltaproteobacteria bacterium]